jgi:hypothetical protein
VDEMGLEENMKDFDLFGIETHSTPPNPHGLRAKRTSPYRFREKDIFPTPWSNHLGLVPFEVD